jgi:multisubunit Na+/H+ antiporter MnhE subunit
VRRLGRLILHSALWFAAWLLFVEKFSADELAAGAVCSLVATFASEIAWGTHLTAFGGDLDALAQARYLPWLMLSGTFEIFAVLFRHLFTRNKADSLMLAVEFEPCDPDEPRDAARRALAVAYTTMTPNFIILGIDQRKRRMLYHQIKRSDVPKMTQNLGARP